MQWITQASSSRGSSRSLDEQGLSHVGLVSAILMVCVQALAGPLYRRQSILLYYLCIAGASPVVLTPSSLASGLTPISVRSRFINLRLEGSSCLVKPKAVSSQHSPLPNRHQSQHLIVDSRLRIGLFLLFQVRAYSRAGYHQLSSSRLSGGNSTANSIPGLT